jgi:hypothetical protein
MTEFLPIPFDLYRRVEPEAGQVLPALTGRYRARRPREEFTPDWRYLLSGRASVEAVVAGLGCGTVDVPGHAWPAVLRTYCPAAQALLDQAGVSVEDWRTGRAEAVLSATVAATANRELGGDAVFAVMDVPALVADVVGELGTVPRFH